MPCDKITNTNLDEYNKVLSVISTFRTTHNVVNYVIGGDMNTDLSRTRSGKSAKFYGQGKFVSSY